MAGIRPETSESQPADEGEPDELWDPDYMSDPPDDPAFD